jgi:hypothetical protein
MHLRDEERGREGERERGRDYQKLHFSGCRLIFTSMPMIALY